LKTLSTVISEKKARGNGAVLGLGQKQLSTKVTRWRCSLLKGIAPSNALIFMASINASWRRHLQSKMYFVPNLTNKILGHFTHKASL
jgi:hypothetical protein